ncbi:LysE family translocator [Pseudomonas massiliensis]|uniref:LysE family translocator n=1 Tax=Pseudomonas massiliensis TaxID=522492 RepID=UPI00058E6F50|nr:LysE family translocator [Pseudomonas massiliensis]
MPDAINLSLFFAAAILLLVVPGPNMAFVTSHALVHGWRGAAAAALGISCSDLLMTSIVSAGIGTLVMTWAPAFELLRAGGVCYLLWLAWQALKRPASTHASTTKAKPLRSIFIQGMVNSLLNPKALLFFMVFLPQFVTVERGNVSFQLGVLGAMLALIALIFHTLLGVCAARIGKALKGSGRFPLANYAFAAVMTALAARLLLLQRPA